MRVFLQQEQTIFPQATAAAAVAGEVALTMGLLYLATVVLVAGVVAAGQTGQLPLKAAQAASAAVQAEALTDQEAELVWVAAAGAMLRGQVRAALAL